MTTTTPTALGAPMLAPSTTTTLHEAHARDLAHLDSALERTEGPASVSLANMDAFAWACRMADGLEAREGVDRVALRLAERWRWRGHRALVDARRLVAEQVNRVDAMRARRGVA